MLAPLLAQSYQFSGTATSSQAAQRSYGFGEVVENGVAATAQTVQSLEGTGNLGFSGSCTTAQVDQTTEASSIALIVGVGGTDQRRQKDNARGLGPPPRPIRPMRSVRGDAATKRPIVLTIKTGA
jgi:hypothetical protein